jgi:hypothetical protein
MRSIGEFFLFFFLACFVVSSHYWPSTNPNGQLWMYAISIVCLLGMATGLQLAFRRFRADLIDQLDKNRPAGSQADS